MTHPQHRWDRTDLSWRQRCRNFVKWAEPGDHFAVTLEYGQVVILAARVGPVHWLSINGVTPELSSSYAHRPEMRGTPTALKQIMRMLYDTFNDRGVHYTEREIVSEIRPSWRAERELAKAIGDPV